MRFRPGQHLRRQSDIRAVREQGRRVDGRAFTVWWRRRTPERGLGAISAEAKSSILGHPSLSASSIEASASIPLQSAAAKQAEQPSPPLPRAAFIASIAAVGPAVRRNRAKRRLRELFRKHQGLIPPECDVLLIARAAAAQWDFTGLERTFVEACRRIPSLANGASPAPAHD